MGTIWLLRRPWHPGGLFVKQLGFSQEQALLPGAFAALVYGLIPIGGYVTIFTVRTKRTVPRNCAGDWLFYDRHVAVKSRSHFIALSTIAVATAI